MRTTRASLCTLLLAGVPAAQVQLAVFAHTDLTVVSHRIPAGTDISGGATLVWNNQHPTLPERASMRVTVAAGSVRFANDVWASASSPPVVGPHAIRVRLTSASPVSGTLRAEGLAFAGSDFQVDVGDDGTRELSRTFGLTADVYEETLTIPAGGIDVIVTASASASGATGSYSANSSVQLSFARAGTNVSRSGTACGAALTARYWRLPVLSTLNRSFELAAENAPVTPYAFFVVGTTPQNVAIPPLGCLLRTDIVVALPVTVDPTGRGAATIRAPQSVMAFDALAQFVAATLDAQQNPLWRTSEAVRLRL